MKLMFLAVFFGFHLAGASSHSLFGVYRGQINPKQSCTLAILEYQENNVASFMIDQNPYIFVSLPELVNPLTQRASKIVLSSVEQGNQDTVEIVIDSKTQQIEVTTNTRGIIAKCTKAFQIRKQD